MSIERFLATVRSSRTAFDEALAQVPDERMLEPGLTGPWSVKDEIAHITWFEQQMVLLVRAHALVGSDLWQLSPHERNDAIFREFRDHSLDEVRGESARVHGELLDLLATLADADLEDPARFPDMPSDWRPGDILAQNTHEHYDAHRVGLLAWLEGSAPPAPGA